MRKISFLCLSILIAAAFSSCKKCYTCTNTCVQCVISSGGTVINVKNLCSDTLGYTTTKHNLESAGYTCSSTGSTYSIDYCINGSTGEDQYKEYYNNSGRYDCKAK